MGDYKVNPNNPNQMIPKGSDEGFTPQSGSDGWQYTNLPTTDPQVSGSLWVSGSSEGPDNSKYLMVSQGS